MVYDFGRGGLMARTQAADYDERRLEIVEAAATLFAGRGFRGASIADVAARCKVSKALIYHYYASKEDILYDVMISHVRALEAAMGAVIAAPAPAREKLRRLARTFMALYVGAADRHKVLLNDLEHLPKGRRNEIVGVQRGLIEAVKRLLIEIEPRLRRSRRVVPAAMLFFGMINWTHTWFDPNGAVGAEELADMVVDIALGGLEQAV